MTTLSIRPPSPQPSDPLLPREPAPTEPKKISPSVIRDLAIGIISFLGTMLVPTLPGPPMVMGALWGGSMHLLAQNFMGAIKPALRVRANVETVFCTVIGAVYGGTGFSAPEGSPLSILSFASTCLPVFLMAAGARLSEKQRKEKMNRDPLETSGQVF